MVKIKDWNIIFDTEGQQLNFVMLCGVWCLLLYFLTGLIPIGYFGILIPTIKGLALFLVVYYLAYCIILTKKIVDKYYK